MNLLQTLFYRKQNPDVAALRDRAIIAESQVVFLQDMLRPKREVRKDARTHIATKADTTAALYRLHPDIAARHAAQLKAEMGRA